MTPDSKEQFEKSDQSISFELWKETKERSRTFYRATWNSSLMFVRAHRIKNFSSARSIIDKCVVFALDHVNYARWLPVYIRDMKSLPSSIKDDGWFLSKMMGGFYQRWWVVSIKDDGWFLSKMMGGFYQRWWVVSIKDDEWFLKHYRDGCYLVQNYFEFWRSEWSKVVWGEGGKYVINKVANPFIDEVQELVTAETV